MRNLDRIMIIGFIVVTYACEFGGNITPKATLDDNRLISKNEAIEIAAKFVNEHAPPEKFRSNTKGEINIREIKGSHGKTAIYIANNDNGGWEIIAGTKVDHPILAYNTEMYFEYDTLEMNVALKMWLSNTIDNMVKAYKDPNNYKEGISLTSNSYIIFPPDPGDCEDYGSSVDRLLVNENFEELRFDQDWPENFYYKSCSDMDENYNGHAYAGCVPVAMAQVMWYYKTPAKYNWSIIPLNPHYINGSSYSEIETGGLFDDIRLSLQPWIWVNCDLGTGAYTSTYNNLDKSFDVFGYDAYEFTSLSTIQSELDHGRPVIAVGGAIKLFKESDRHCWVIDGYHYSYLCSANQELLSLHCNWGWGGTENGWFGASGFTLAGSDLTHNLKFFKVIKR